MATNEPFQHIASPSMSESQLSFHYGAFVGGLSDPSTAQFKDRREVLNLVNQLHSHGLQGDVDIPQIAVVGSQSVGKSSLIESIAGITLPRAQGTCTRCPIECRLFRTKSPWTCEVYLRITGRTDEIPFGNPVTNRSEVDERIRRAQLAILNPSRRATDFLGTLGSLATSTNMENEQSFSKDLISVRISGREVDNLSFVDLPGVIASVRDGGTETDIDAVKNLVLDVIKKPSCLILLVVSAETDPENQGARHLARNADPSGSRTILVTTKPDRIARGQEHFWIKYLSKNQGFCVKQCDQQQLDAGTDWADARQFEEDFFKETWPWNTQPQEIKARYGTSNLTRALGKKLYNLICRRLPGLVQEIEERVRQIKHDIEAFPSKPSGDPVATLMNLLDAFKMDVATLVKGSPEAGKDGLVQTFRDLKGSFREAIKRRTPEFKPYEKPPPASYRAATQVVTGQGVRTPSLWEPALVNSVVGMSAADIESTVLPRGAPTIYLNEVLDFAKNARTRELPDNHPYDVIEHFVTLLTNHWPLPAQSLFDNLENRFRQELTRLVGQRFSAYAPGNLDDAVMSTVLNQLSQCSTVAQERMRQCIALEREEPATLNEEILADCKREYHTKYTVERRAHVVDTPSLQSFMSGAFDSSSLQQVLQTLQAVGFGHVTKEDLLRSLPVDESDKGIKIMAEVRAYYEVAFRRYIDYIPMVIDFELLKGFSRTLGGALFQGLALEEDIRERCANFLIEDPQIAREREVLQQDLQRFRAALADLQRISGTASASTQGTEEVPVTRGRDDTVDLADEAIPYAENATDYDEEPPQPPPSPPLPMSPLLQPGTPMHQPFISEEYSFSSRPHSPSMVDLDPVPSSSYESTMDWYGGPPAIPAPPHEQPGGKKGKKKKPSKLLNRVMLSSSTPFEE